ncbi:DUF6088 family protein [Flavihumibacter profundi]|uniref:DUF6088 family protein n=1 Tax=Flavihumibacter profundi TaxID=2716883 RepID=UPI001CC391A1|nr:DUF6088 family protein [Flavihumibacter profundi]MBZ5857544.1 DUF6088 family protein [Flavihumibacter profundi]
MSGFLHKKHDNAINLLTFALEKKMMKTMSVTNNIKRIVSSIPEGQVFDFNRFAVTRVNEQAVVKALSRLVQTGEIVRVEKGKYYKPRQTRFGTLRPSENEVVKMVTEKGSQTIGYITGITLYNKLGLTTQVSNVLVIARNGRLPVKQVNGYKIKFITRQIRFSQKDIPLLQLLDVIRNIKDIPDTTVNKSVTVLKQKLSTLSEDELKRLIKLSLQYNPATRAVLGAILECNSPSVNVSELRKTLNPVTKYKIGISQEGLPNLSNWNIE